jgi:type I restriction enzyme S subunit
MSSEWRECTLGELVNIKHGFAFSGEHISKNQGKRVLVTPGNFEIGGGFKEGNAKYFHGPYPEEYVFAPSDLIVTMTDLSKTADTLGYSAKIPREESKIYLHNQRVGKVIAKSSDANLDFLYWVMRHKDYRNLVVSTATGSTVRHTSPSRILAYSFLLPPPSQQQAIAHILGTLDDKIELNRKTNETLEAMAKTLFKSWFVDFDPVRAKAEGRTTGLPAEISDLFPDSFEDSDLGEIPKGWEVGSLDQIGINPRETAKPEDMDSSDRYIGLEHMPRGSICLGESGQAEELESNKNRFRKGDLLFGKLRPYFKKTGCSQFDGVCSTDIVVVRKKGEYGVGFICCFLASDPFIDFTVAASSGTRMPRTSWKDMCEFPFAIPSKLLLCEFDKQFCHVINKITGNCIHSAYLAVLRDALLPKLISGELRIPDAEKMLEEAGI